jgi:hypothetical protein
VSSTERYKGILELDLSQPQNFRDAFVWAVSRLNDIIAKAHWLLRMIESYQEIYPQLGRFRERAEELKMECKWLCIRTIISVYLEGESGLLEVTGDLKEVLEKVGMLDTEWNDFIVERNLGVIFL